MDGNPRDDGTQPDASQADDAGQGEDSAGQEDDAFDGRSAARPQRVARTTRSVMLKTMSPIRAASGMGPRDWDVPQPPRTVAKHVPTR
jgi:hypothetical protein